jgi:hypothetical protein
MAEKDRHPSDSQRHPGITMHKLSIGGGFEGLVFTVGSALIFLFGLPSLWYFLAFSAALGVGVAVLIRLINRSSTDGLKHLSILSADDMPKTPPVPRSDEGCNRFDSLQGILPALVFRGE